MKNHEWLHSHVMLPMIIILTSTCVFFNACAPNTIKSLTDIDGNTYKTIVIGEQEWMAEDLKTTKFNDGSDIPNITDMTEWVRMESPAYSWYNNDYSENSTYGALYNWHAVSTDKLCPTGWTVPTDDDWKMLTDHLGGDYDAVVKLKELDFLSSFGGYRYGYYWGSGIFYEIDVNAYWWTATTCTDTHVWTRTINQGNSKIYRSYFVKNNGFAVRCIKCN